MQERLTALENRTARLEREKAELKAIVAQLQRQARQREVDTAYLYIHSNGQWIRWFLTRERDLAAADSEQYRRARDAESAIALRLPPSLRAIQFDPQPMAAAYRWRIETTVTLNRHGYTFFD